MNGSAHQVSETACGKTAAMDAAGRPLTRQVNAFDLLARQAFLPILGPLAEGPPAAKRPIHQLFSSFLHCRCLKHPVR